MKIKKLTVIPKELSHIPSPPRELYTLGPIEELLESPMLAIVGSRKVTPYGKAVTERLAQELAEQGMVIVSGLALGVDSIAHQAAIDAGGKTIAVLPAGLDQIYPRSHFQLANQILETGGALISEYPAGMPPLKENFVARNRLVSGLSQGVLITEAAAKSGTLHTANFALDQGKTVFAIPGNITSDLSAGTNNLIKIGAIPVTDVNDILSALNLVPSDKKQHRPKGNTQAEEDILEILASGTSDGSLLLATSGLSAPEFNQTLTMLEITGKVRSLGAGHWTLK